jgi:hypothetical protein
MAQKEWPKLPIYFQLLQLSLHVLFPPLKSYKLQPPVTFQVWEMDVEQMITYVPFHKCGMFYKQHKAENDQE